MRSNTAIAPIPCYKVIMRSTVQIEFQPSNSRAYTAAASEHCLVAFSCSLALHAPGDNTAILLCRMLGGYALQRSKLAPLHALQSRAPIKLVPMQSSGLVRHVFRLLDQALRDRRAVPWVLLENVRTSPPSYHPPQPPPPFFSPTAFSSDSCFIILQSYGAADTRSAGK